MATILISVNSSALVLAVFAFWAGSVCGRSEKINNGGPTARQEPSSMTGSIKKQIQEPSLTLGSGIGYDINKGTSPPSEQLPVYKSRGKGRVGGSRGQPSSTTNGTKHSSVGVSFSDALHSLDPNLTPSVPPIPDRSPQRLLPRNSQEGPHLTHRLNFDASSYCKTCSSADKNTNREDVSRREDLAKTKIPQNKSTQWCGT